MAVLWVVHRLVGHRGVAKTHNAVRNVHLKEQTNRQVVTPAYFEKIIIYA